MRNEIELRLLNDFQHDFPLCPTPFGVIGRRLGARTQAVLDMLEKLRQEGKIARVGPVFAPGCLGSSTLAAMAVPAASLDETASIVSGFVEVNHNYARDHCYNLWFVLTAPGPARLQAALAEIAAATACVPIVLPLLEEFHIDLGFPLDGRNARRRGSSRTGSRAAPDTSDRHLLAEIQEGLPLSERPFDLIANRIGSSEREVIERIRRWQADGTIRRFGIVVRHRTLGYAANAMLVHDIPDSRVRALGRELAGEAAITLCYRRPRVLPQWPYNLFCMIHGRERSEVDCVIARLRERHQLDAFAHEVLFSSKCYKQTGARYA